MNVVKHAQAKTVEIRLGRRNNKVQVMIKDDGKGFNVQEKRKSGRGLGLALMKERAQLIDGKLNIKSVAGAGTEIRLTVPIEERKSDEN